MTLSRCCAACFTLLLIALFCVPPLPAQESRWNELNAQVLELYQQGKYAEAIPIAAEALKVAEAAFGPHDTRVATSLNNLAQLYSNQGRYGEAESFDKRALDIDEKALGPDHPDVARDLNNLAALYYIQGMYAEAEPLFQRALRIDEKALGPDHPGVATDLNNLAELYSDEGKYAEAEPLFQRALRIDEKALGPDHPNVATALNNLAKFFYIQGIYAEAEPLYQRALRIHEKALGPDHPDVATDLNNLAALYMDQGKYAEAEPLYQRAFDNLFQQFQYNFTYMTEKDRLGFLDTVSFQFPVYFSFVHRYHGQDPSLTGSMYNLLLWEKGFIASSIAGMRRQIESSGDKQATRFRDCCSPPALYHRKYHPPLRTLVRSSNSRFARSQSCSAYPS